MCLFISEKLLKYDSIFFSKLSAAIKNDSRNINFSGKSFPKTNSQFLIIQESDKTHFYGTVGSSVLSYVNDKISNWKLIDETKTINSLICQKAQLKFKGRDWIAWYSNEIPFPYGPYKFGGLPGLIVKITDKTGDYDFELVKSASSSKLKKKNIKIDKKHYEKAKLVTKSELIEAKENFRKNLFRSMENDGVILSQDQINSFRERLKKDEIEKKGYNPIELEN